MPTMPTAAVEASAMKAMVKAVMVKPMMVVKEPKPEADRYRNAVAIVVWVGVGIAVRGIILVVPGIILLAVFIVVRIVAVDRGITLSLDWLCLPHHRSENDQRGHHARFQVTENAHGESPSERHSHKYTLPVHLPGSQYSDFEGRIRGRLSPASRRVVAC